MRVFAFSDLHVDYAENLDHITALSAHDYRDDVLILAGDVSDDWGLLEQALATLRDRFARVLFVPGNHDLWHRDRRHNDVLERFQAVLACCRRLDVDTEPVRLHDPVSDTCAWVVPLHSWYRTPEQGERSLFAPKQQESHRQVLWADDRHIHWPRGIGQHPPDYFLALNEPRLHDYDAPVISFSHFLPRRELIFGAAPPGVGPTLPDPHPHFNFSRVAGCAGLDEQLRRIGSILHVYGHQHRNRRRHIEGVDYVSHCLGYPRERNRGYLRGDAVRPRCIWNPGGQVD